jgi:hypothetical protein
MRNTFKGTPRGFFMKYFSLVFAFYYAIGGKCPWPDWGCCNKIATVHFLDGKYKEVSLNYDSITGNCTYPIYSSVDHIEYKTTTIALAYKTITENTKPTPPTNGVNKPSGNNQDECKNISQT